MAQDGPYSISVPPDQTSVEIDDLQEGLTYSFMVRVVACWD